ncbi:hypothetical protein [Kordiimonas sp.]|uniref:hypothetical protein n=1 Tax=Kordiimonas sp. TaxID=1970157 RepID=UPI003A90D2E9
MFKISKAVAIAGLVFAVSVVSVNAEAQSTKTLYLSENGNLERGMESLRQGNLKSAAKHLRRAVRADLGTERLVPALSNLCAVEYALGELASAEEHCSRAIGEDRHFWRAYVNRGNVYKAKGSYEAAHADYRRAEDISSNDLTVSALASLEADHNRLVAEAK